MVKREPFAEGQDPFFDTTTLPIDDEVSRQLAARRRTREELELERLRQRQEARRAKKRARDRKRHRVLFDWPVWLIEAVSRIADREGVSKSQAAAFLMRLAVLIYENGTSIWPVLTQVVGPVEMGAYKRVSRTPRWEWGLEIPEPREGDGPPR